MNLPRYIITGAAAIAIHAALLFVIPDNKVIAMPSGANTTSVSIKFLAPSVIQTKSVPQKSVPTEVPVTRTVVPPPKQKIIKHALKKVKKQPKKEVTKPENKPLEKATEQPKQDQPKKNVDKSAEQTPEVKPQAIKKGVSNKPILINKPSFLSRPTQPRYPRMARRRGIEGSSTYEVWLDEKGRQIKQILVLSSGAPSLDKAALRAIKQWRFSPHTINGRAVAHRIKIPVRFKLD